jgi:hypothetical protein
MYIRMLVSIHMSEGLGGRGAKMLCSRRFVHLFVCVCVCVCVHVVRLYVYICLCSPPVCVYVCMYTYACPAVVLYACLCVYMCMFTCGNTVCIHMFVRIIVRYSLLVQFSVTMNVMFAVFYCLVSQVVSDKFFFSTLSIIRSKKKPSPFFL